MNRKNIFNEKTYNYFIIFIAAIIVFLNFYKIKVSDINGLIPQLIFIPMCILMGVFVINVNEIGSIDLTDSIAAFIFVTYGIKSGIIFSAVAWVISEIVNERIIAKQHDIGNAIFNTSVFIIALYGAAMSISIIPEGLRQNDIVRYLLYSVGFIGVFLIINLLIIMINVSIIRKEFFRFEGEALILIGVNFLLSSFVTFTLLNVYKASGLIGAVLITCNLLVLHYCFHIYRRLKIRNDSIKGLLKVTQDIVKYGDFRDKCKCLIQNLKNLIPYLVCSIYIFDVEDEGWTFPVAYSAPENIDIGDLSFNLSSTGTTIKTVREGKIHISKDTKRDKKIRLMGRLDDAVKAAIIIPVLIEDKIVGFIFIGGGNVLINFTMNGIEDLLQILSNQMALAIENDGIYRDIKNKADIDHLTKLFNRRAFDREIHELIDLNNTFSMVIYDIDDFKIVNDKYGHLAGDEVLKTVSEIIKKSIRKTDVPCRYGGEEIVIIFKDLCAEDAYIISDRIRRNIEKVPTIWEGEEIFVTVSGGVSSFPNNGKSRDDIIKAADDILYSQCKRNGKNKVCASSN